VEAAAVATTIIGVHGAEQLAAGALTAPLDLQAEATLKIRRTTSRASRCMTKRKRAKNENDIKQGYDISICI